MRWFVEIACAFAALAASAFDSTEWLGQRMLFDREAERLRAAYVKCAASAADPATDVTIPVEGHPDGSVKTSVAAERAQMFPKEGLIWCSGVKIRQYRADGTVESQIDADSCVVDRATRSGWAEGRAYANYRGGEAELSGEGVYFSAAEEYLKIASNTVLKTGGRVLKAVRADYDRQGGVAMFDGCVSLRGAEDGHEYELSADQAFAFMTGTNEFRRVVALGGVAVASGDRTGTCARAVYSRRDSKVTMYGDGEGRPARLVDGGRRRSEVEGSRITFWLDSEQVEVADSAVTLDAKGFKLPAGGGAR